MLLHILFIISITAAGVIFLLSLASVRSANFQFWPPPAKNSWQHKSFLLLFRCFVYPLIGLTFLEFEYLQGTRTLIQYALGIALFLTGFGLAFRITFHMGWKNAFGEKLGLRTDGHFSWSRNPVYVVTWIGLFGWMLIANSLLVSILLTVWAILYLLAPLLEEPWLERIYGDDYRRYKKQVRRYF